MKSKAVQFLEANQSDERSTFVDVETRKRIMAKTVPAYSLHYHGLYAESSSLT